MGLDTQISVITSCVKDREYASPMKIVHSRGRIGDRAAARVSGSLYVEMRDLLAVIRHFSEIIRVSVIRVRRVVFQPKIGIFTEDDLPLLGRIDKIVPMAVLDGDLDTAWLRSFGKLCEELERDRVILVKRYLVRIVTAANKGLGSKLDSRVKLSEIYAEPPLVDLTADVDIVIPTSDARNVDTRARDLRLDTFLVGDQLFSLSLIVTADLDKLKIRILYEVKPRLGVVILYSSYSHIENLTFPNKYEFIVPYIQGFVNKQIGRENKYSADF